MVGPVAAAALFSSSFAPLFVVFGLLDTFGRGWESWVCYLVAAVSVGGLGLVMRSARQLPSVPVEAVAAKPRDNDAIGYVVTYLLPFAALGTTDWRARTAILIFLAVIAVLYVRAGLYYVNPVLSLVGYRIFEIELKDGGTLVVISRRRHLRASTAIRVRSITDYVSLESTDE